MAFLGIDKLVHLNYGTFQTDTCVAYSVFNDVSIQCLQLQFARNTRLKWTKTFRNFYSKYPMGEISEGQISLE